MANRRLHNNWDGFRYFLLVARTGTLSAAAVQLGTEHTTVARQIRLLEGELSRQLFHRTNQGYELTEAGQRLFPKAQAIESAIIAAKYTAGEEQVTGKVRIGAPDGFGTFFLAPLLGALSQLYPRLSVEILATSRLFNLSRRDADIVISISESHESRVFTRRFLDYHLYVYGSKEYLERFPQLKTRFDLRKHAFVSYPEGIAFSSEPDYLEIISTEADARIHSMSLVAQAYATAGGAGLCVLPSFLERNFPSLIPVLPKEVTLPRSLHMHVHDDHRRAPNIRAVMAFLTEQVKADPALFRPRHSD